MRIFSNAMKLDFRQAFVFLSDIFIHLIRAFFLCLNAHTSENIILFFTGKNQNKKTAKF